jgi:hypothetical protein
LRRYEANIIDPKVLGVNFLNFIGKENELKLKKEVSQLFGLICLDECLQLLSERFGGYNKGFAMFFLHYSFDSGDDGFLVD